MFWNLDDVKSSHYTMDNYREWASEITSSYINAGATPTDVLCKIAQSAELEPHQIKTLAHEANKAIHAVKYAQAKEKYFAADFPLADAEFVITKLQAGVVKTASYFVEPEKVEQEGPSPFEMFKVKPEEMDKTASISRQLKHASLKTEMYQDKLKSTMIMKIAALKDAEKAFVKEARSYTLSDDSSLKRMKTLGVLDHFVKQAGISLGKEMLAKVAYVLKREGLLEPQHANSAIEYFMSKEADCKAPESMISDNLHGTVVNGNHPLYITLKTIADHEADYHRYHRESNIVDDKVRILKQKIRAL